MRLGVSEMHHFGQQTDPHTKSLGGKLLTPFFLSFSFISFFFHWYGLNPEPGKGEI
jgi:hypothetical protein